MGHGAWGMGKRGREDEKRRGSEEARTRGGEDAKICVNPFNLWKSVEGKKHGAWGMGLPQPQPQP